MEKGESAFVVIDFGCFCLLKDPTPLLISIPYSKAHTWAKSSYFSLLTIAPAAPPLAAAPLASGAPLRNVAKVLHCCAPQLPLLFLLLLLARSALSIPPTCVIG